MTEKGEYDVLRLIEHNQVCYISSGCIRGMPLMGWLKYHRVMKKQEFVRMVRLLARQLEKPARPSTAQILQAALLDEEASDFLTTGAPIDTKALLSSLKDMEEDDA